MKKIILLFLFLVSSLHSQEIPKIFNYYFSPIPSSNWVATFSGYDTTIASTNKTLPSPFTGTWLYFNGATRGYFMKCLASIAMQRWMKNVMAYTDSSEFYEESYNVTTARIQWGNISGSTGYRVGVGLNNGANQKEFYLQGAGHITVDTIAGDTSWHSYRYRMNNNADAGTDQFRCWVDGVLWVNTATYTFTGGYDATFPTSWGNTGVPLSVSDTTQQSSGTTSYWKGGLRAWRYTKWKDGVDSTAEIIFTGYGQTVIMNVYVNGTLLYGWETIDRPNYTGALDYSHHIFRGTDATSDRHDPVWVNTAGSAPSYITALGSLWMWDSSANANLQRESYTNGECLFTNSTGDTTWLVVSGQINNFDGDVDVLGTESVRIARYNLKTNTWQTLPNFKPNGNVTTLCQRGDTLIVGGQYTGIEGVANTNRLSGYIWSTETAISIGTCNGDVGFVGMIGSNLFAGGGFTTIGGVSANRVAMNDGTGWKAYGTGMANSVNQVVLYNTDTLFGGSFTTANGVTCNGLAKWNGTTFVNYGHGVKLNSGGVGLVFTMMPYNNKLYIGGQFDSVQSVYCKNYIELSGTSTFTNIGGCTRGSNIVDVAVIDQWVDPVHNVLGIVGQFSRWNDRIASCMVMYNGSEFILCPAIDLRPEGIRITSDARWLVVGDQYGVYGKNVFNAFELSPTWSR